MKRIMMIATVLGMGVAGLWASNEECVPRKLLCDYLVNPLGVDNPHPRLSWQLEDARQGAKQTAYQLWVGTDSMAVIHDKGDMWDTEKQSSDAMLHPYAGNSLQPFTRYYWKTKVWDKDGVASVSEIKSFETGMMNMRNWQGAWIGDNQDIDYKPAPYFRKVFQTQKKMHPTKQLIHL